MSKKIDFSKIPDKQKAYKLRRELVERKILTERKKELHDKLNLSYRYFRFHKKGKEVSVSIGYKFVGDMIVYSVALQSKNDNFSRKEARRVINERWKYDYVVEFHVGFKTKEIDVTIACHYNSKKSKPEEFGLVLIPKYLEKIPIKIG